MIVLEREVAEPAVPLMIESGDPLLLALDERRGYRVSSATQPPTRPRWVERLEAESDEADGLGSLHVLAADQDSFEASPEERPIATIAGDGGRT